MPPSSTIITVKRFIKALSYIDANLDDVLTLKQLNRIAALSPFHFHRLFTQHFGMGIYQYVQLCRFKRASSQLAFPQQLTITEIALNDGYSVPESFARSFKQRFGQSPSAFRQAPHWPQWKTVLQPLQVFRKTNVSACQPTKTVKIITCQDIPIAVLTHHGDPNLLGDSLRIFIAWRRAQRLSPSVSATYNIIYNDPAQVAPEDFRLGLCAATDQSVAPNALGIVSQTIPGGRCAVLRHIGPDDTLNCAVRYLYQKWLPQSGESLRDFPLYLQRIKFFPDVPEREAIIDIFLPIA